MKKFYNIRLTYLDKPHTISDINNLSVETILSLADELHISEAKQLILKNIIKMNIGYLTVNRIMGTLFWWRTDSPLPGGVHGGK